MSEHTKGLLRVGRPGAVVADHPVPEMSGSDALDYYGGHMVAESVTAANARRIVACWNACLGLPTDELEQRGLASAFGNQLLQVEKQRDVLLELLREARNPLITAMEVSSEDASAETEELLERIDALLADRLPDPAVTVTETIRTAPERIWLQVGDQSHYHSEPFPSDTSDVSWCADSVMTCEVPYVRADLVGQKQEQNKTNWPDKCPITRRDFFMEIDGVPTYGGPYDSYTIPEMLGTPEQPWHERELFVRRFDHDRGCWVDDEIISQRVIHDGVLDDLLGWKELSIPEGWKLIGYRNHSAPNGLRRFMTPKQYGNQTDGIKKWYEPVYSAPVPEGWQLVPVEPSAQELVAMRDAWSASPYSEDLEENLLSGWQAVLAATPKPECWCHTCRPVTSDDMRMVLCPECGNKRCPRANDHRNACTGSNEPGQEGSAYPAAPKPQGGEPCAIEPPSSSPA
ncbi:hypothetical protein VCX45_04850 [Aeromonas caviae]|uniref:hypothetical protein n=1 Tax=Aeromonas caviae TaxID=648 RepID=UPI002B240665|nr:hypothetical protein [Aeromonas caviae]MEA9440033.1 hypothetical protein [Aeromonas caviae]